MSEAVEAQSSVRPIPLKIAAAIGLLTTAMTIAVTFSQPASVWPAVFWIVLMASASLLAWFADQFRGRQAAVGAAIIFFVLGVLSSPLLAIILLVAVMFCMFGFMRWPKR